MIRGLRDRSSRLKASLIDANAEREAPAQSAASDVDRAREEGRRAAADAIAAEIRATAPRGHGKCAGVPWCAACAVAAQAERLARLAELEGAPASAPGGAR